MADKKQLDLTPTEELIIDVLVARFRLGETIWPFDLRNAAALRRLESRGLINRMGGNVEDTERAWLTEKALRKHGPSWFQLDTTMRHLPDEGFPRWCKKNLAILDELAQTVSETDPQAINAAHLLIIQMISRHLPVSHITRGTGGGITLFSALSSIEIDPDGLSYRLLRSGTTLAVTSERSEALRFAVTAWN